MQVEFFKVRQKYPKAVTTSAAIINQTYVANIDKNLNALLKTSFVCLCDLTLQSASAILQSELLRLL